MRQHRGNAPQRLRAGFADFDQAGALLEVVDPQRRGKARRAAGGQHMIRAGAVIAQRFAGVGPQKDRARVAQQRLPAVRVLAGDFQMLGRDAVADRAGFFHVARENQRAAVVEALGNDGRARHLGQQAVDFALHGVEIVGVGAQQNALRQFVVLGLAEQVHGHPFGGRAAVGQHQDFRGAGNHVYAHGAEHALLGAGDIGIARSGDLVDLGHGLRAVGQRAHGLGAAYGERAVHAGHVGRGQHQRVLRALGRGNDHDDFADTGHMRRNRVHQHA